MPTGKKRATNSSTPKKTKVTKSKYAGQDVRKSLMNFSDTVKKKNVINPNKRK